MSGEPTNAELIIALGELSVEVQRARSRPELLARVSRGLGSLGYRVAALRVAGSTATVAAAAAPRELLDSMEACLGRSLEGLTLSLGYLPSVEQAIAEDRPLHWDDATPLAARFFTALGGRPPRLFDLAREFTGGRVAIAPLRVGGVPWGALIVASPTLTAGDVAAFRLFAAHVAASLEAVDALDLLARRNRELAAVRELSAARGGDGPGSEAERQIRFLSTLWELGRAGSETRAVEPLVARVLERLSEDLAIDAAAIHALEDDRLVLAGPRFGDWDPVSEEEMRVLPLSVGELPGLAIRERRTVTERLPAVRLPGSLAVRLGMPYTVTVPLLARDQVVGTLSVGRRGERSFAPEEVQLLEICAAQVAVALENAQLFEQKRQRVEQLRHLLEVGRAITASLDLEQILEAAAGALVRMIEAATAHVFLLDPERPVLRGAATSVAAHRDLIRNTEVPLDGPSASARAIALRAPVAVPDTTDPRAEVQRQITAALGERSILAVPLLVRDRPIGVVVIGDSRDQRRWSSGEVERTSLVAHQLAVAVANSRLYEDLRRSYAELARAQEELVKRERLAALGELSAVVAHEVRNPLGVIYNAMGPLRRLLRPEGDAKTLLDIVGEEAERLNRIVSDLLDFARPHEPVLEEVSLRELLDELLDRMKGDPAARQVALAVDLPPELPPLPLDAGMIRRAFLNLVQNAMQASPEGGTVRVSARADGDGVTVEIADRGPGVPEELREKIFQPFFTTRANGTGLGLAVVKRIVEEHRGRVEVTSPPGGGATVSVWLPRRAP